MRRIFEITINNVVYVLMETDKIDSCNLERTSNIIELIAVNSLSSVKHTIQFSDIDSFKSILKDLLKSIENEEETEKFLITAGVKQ